jgi:hypothetical protein
VDIGYAVGEAASSACHAKSCEARKRDIRAELRANDKAWQTSQSKISARIRDECPDIGWDKTGHEECKSRVLAESDLDMQVFALEDRELREKMAGIDPEKCKVWSGNLTSR